MLYRLLGSLLLLSALCGLAALVEDRVPPKPAPTPIPAAPDCPDGKCPPSPPPRKPWGAEVGATVGGPRHADGTEIQLDLPGPLHQRNAGGIDRAGLCVYASARHSGLWSDEPALIGLFEWMKGHPGGSYPEKFDRTLAQFCKEKGLPAPLYLNVAETTDIELLKRACAAGLMPGVTYGRSPTGRYRGQPISHMVSLVHADERWFVILDNNYPGAAQYEWLSPEEFKRTWSATAGTGWALIPLKPGPPPVPVNAQEQRP